MAWYFTDHRTGRGSDGYDGRSQRMMVFGSGSGGAWSTGDGGATGILTLNGWAQPTAPGGVPGLVYYLASATESGWYRITRVIDNDSAEMALLDGHGITSDASVANTTGPFRTIEKAMQTVAPGDKVWVSAGSDYTDQDGGSGAIGAIRTAGTATYHIVFEGFRDFIGDGDGQWFDDTWRPTLDAGPASLDRVLVYPGAAQDLHYLFKHLVFAGGRASSGGMVDTGAGRSVGWVNCKVMMGGNHGWEVGAHHLLYGCEADGCDGDGFVIGAGGQLIHGRSHGNGGRAARLTGDGIAVIGLLAHGNGLGAVQLAGAGSSILDSTIDGNGHAGITVLSGPAIIANSLLHNCSMCVEASPVQAGGTLLHGNVFGKYTTGRLSSGLTPIEIGSVDLGADATGEDFGFIDVAGGDYRIGRTGPALATGWPAYRSIGWYQARLVDPVEVHLVKAMLCNRKTHELATGTLTVFDDDGLTRLLTITPSESGGVVTLNPEVASTGEPGDTAAELHLAKAALANRREHTIDTGVDVIKDDDGVSVMLMLIPSEDVGLVNVMPG